jgi:cytoskeleton protein RodZ
MRLVVGDRPAWVEITQADGRIVLTGLQEPGTERRLGNLQPPLQVVIGNASGVTLEYRGRTVDLKRHARANDLARLTLE